MATIFRESDIDSELIKRLKVAVVGYGNQGHAHALNLRDSGVEVRVGLYSSSASWAKAEAEDLVVGTVGECARWADVLIFCTPDVPMADIYCEGVVEHLRPGQTMLFAHGFSIVYQQIVPPPFVDVALVSPKGPGHWLREKYLAGSGLAALVAVHQDPSGGALQTALSYAAAIGCARVGILQTTFTEETETDLFGEQAVLCGGIPELIKAGFQALVDAGYQPEVAYFECVHEAKLIVDLLLAKGFEGMRRAISDTAEWGGYQAGLQIVDAASRTAMQSVLERIRSGEFAREWIEESRRGAPRMLAARSQEAQEKVEQVSSEMREMLEG